jgi:hypothetical protein
MCEVRPVETHRLRCQRKDGRCSVFGDPCPGLDACVAEIAARNWPKCQTCGGKIAPSGTQATRCNACIAKELAAEVNAAPAPVNTCTACGSTTGAVLYNAGPLAGHRRCWTCAKPVLTGEAHG